MLLSIINSLIVFFISIYLSFYMAKGREYVPLISWSMVAIGIIYGLGSSIVFYSSYHFKDFLGSELILLRSNYWPLYGIFTLVLIFGIFLGWKTPLIKSNKLSNLYNLSKSEIVGATFLILLLGVFLRWIYVQAFGGFSGYLEYSRLIRSGIFEVNNPYSFLQPFGYLVVLSCYLFYALWLKNKKNILIVLGFVLSFLFSIYILYSNVGRIAFISFIATLFLVNLYNKKVKPHKILSIILISFPIIFFFLYILSNYLEVKGADDPFIYFVKETSFVFGTFLIQYTDGYLYRMFSDLIVSPIHFLPSSITHNLYETASQTNTILFHGAKKGEQDVTGGIPVDLLSLGLMQLNVFGIFPIGFLFGYLLKNFEYFLLNIKNTYIKVSLLTYVSLRISFLGVLYAHSDHFISGFFPIIVLLLFLMVVKMINNFIFRK